MLGALQSSHAAAGRADLAKLFQELASLYEKKLYHQVCVCGNKKRRMMMMKKKKQRNNQLFEREGEKQRRKEKKIFFFFF